jgi:phosphoglycolate/pyridoxal phosphate phosphatase family enzyme
MRGFQEEKGMLRNNKDVAPLRGVRYFLLDMDGTIYLDTTLFDGTLDFLDILKKQRKRAIYITNNSSKNTKEYIKKLHNIGIETTEEDFCTSAHALVYNLKKVLPGARIYLVGTPPLAEYLEENGFVLVDDYTEDPEARPDFVVLGFDTTVTYEKLRIACDYLRDEVEFWATHPDMVCPMRPGHPVPDAGAFLLLFKGATGREPSFVAGKPNPCMIQMVMDKYGLRPEEVAVVGDRLNTDILSAVNAGVISVCVLTGESQLEDIDAAPPEGRPDYVFDSIKDLYLLLAGDETTGDSFSGCGGNGLLPGNICNNM